MDGSIGICENADIAASWIRIRASARRIGFADPEIWRSRSCVVSRRGDMDELKILFVRGKKFFQLGERTMFLDSHTDDGDVEHFGHFTR